MEVIKLLAAQYSPAKLPLLLVFSITDQLLILYSVFILVFVLVIVQFIDWKSE